MANKSMDREKLEALANTDVNTDEDAELMQNLLHTAGFGKARCLHGVVYLEGYGQPLSIQTIAKMILAMV